MKHNYNLDIFHKENDMSYYLLGAFITDGCIRDAPAYRATLTSKDEDWLLIIKNLISKDISLEKGNSDKGTLTKRLTINSKKLINWFIAHNCVPRKSLILEMPNVPSLYIRDFLRGCIDGDGNINVHKQSNSGYNKTLNYNVSCTLSTASEKFATQISDILTGLNFKNSIRITKPGDRKIKFINDRAIIQKNNLYDIRMHGNCAWRFIDFIYYKDHSISMPRKNRMAQFIINRCFKSKIKLSTSEIENLLYESFLLRNP